MLLKLLVRTDILIVGRDCMAMMSGVGTEAASPAAKSLLYSTNST
jgi:hypothetical protein